MSYAWLFGLAGLGICTCASAAQVVAHRGDSSRAPENTLAAVKLAWQEGAPAVEIDVYLSRDKRIMLMHDPTTGRTGGTNLKISETDSAELRKLDVGSFKGEEFKGEKMPFFEEVLATIPEGRKLLVEVKCGPEILPLMKDALDHSGKASQVIIISFNLQVCAQAKKVMPSIPALLLLGPTRNPDTGDISEHSAKHIDTARSHRLDGLDMHFSGITQGFADAVKEAGLMLYAWTVNDLEEARRLKQIGVDGITTDRPGWMLKEL